MGDLANYAKTALGALGVAVGAAEAFNLLKQGIQFSVNAAAEAQTVDTKLAAVVAATGGVAGTTASELEKMAGGLSRTSGVEQDTIKNSEALMATFYNIGKNVFPEAMKAALDMSAVLGQDLQSSVMQLGKALQEPGTAFTALQRVGIMFSAAQKEIIQGLVATGDIAGAQEKILAEVNKEFGGAAQANALTYSGSVNAVSNSFKDLGAALAGGQNLNVMKEFNFQLSDGITLLAQYLAESNQFQTQDPLYSKFLDPNRTGKDTIDSLAAQRVQEQQLVDGKQKDAAITANLQGMGVTYTATLGQETLWVKQLGDQYRVLQGAKLASVQMDKEKAFDFSGMPTKGFDVTVEPKMDWSAIDRDVSGKIITLRANIDFVKAGGLDLSKAADDVNQALTAKKITPEQAKSMLGELFVAAEKIKADLGDETSWAAIVNVSKGMGVDFTTAKTMLDGIMNDISLIPNQIHIEITADLAGSGAWLLTGKGGQITPYQKGYQPAEQSNAFGADFIVPAGYTGDTYRINATTGEHVTVTPVGQEPRGGGAINVYGHVYNYPSKDDMSDQLLRLRGAS